VPWLSILDNLLLVAGDEHCAEAMAILIDVELGGSEHAFPAQLSGGMQRRASLARALLAEPALLLLDEPFISLDTACAGRMRRLLTAYWQERDTTILLVTHDLREAVELSTRIVALSPDEGRLTSDLPISQPYPRNSTDASVEQILDNLRPVTQDWPQPASSDAIERKGDTLAPPYLSQARSRFLALSRSIA
jgi:NitT/TauT family transport system ATP-binding protein